MQSQSQEVARDYDAINESCFIRQYQMTYPHFHTNFYRSCTRRQTPVNLSQTSENLDELQLPLAASNSFNILLAWQNQAWIFCHLHFYKKKKKIIFPASPIFFKQRKEVQPLLDQYFVTIKDILKLGKPCASFLIFFLEPEIFEKM